MRDNHGSDTGSEGPSSRLQAYQASDTYVCCTLKTALLRYKQYPSMAMTRGFGGSSTHTVLSHVSTNMFILT